MLEVIPISGFDWNFVEEEHAKKFPGRDVLSLRRKFALLHRRQIKTGDTNMPKDVRLAKRIKYLQGQRADVGDCTEVFDIERGMNFFVILLLIVD